MMPGIVIYGTHWCGDCVRAKRLLDEYQLEYTFLDLDTQPELAEIVISYNEQLGLGPKRRIPIIVIGDTVLSEPSNEELAHAAGIKS
jgi:glutaredoxin